MPVAFLVEHRGRGRYFFRWKLSCYLGLRPSYGHVGAHDWFAQRLYKDTIFFQRVQNSTPGRPVMSPAPNFDSLAPPNEKGSRGTGTPMLTPIMPLVARSLTVRATAPLVVNTLVALP